MNYAVRISMTFNDISGVIMSWREKLETLIIYEHEADDEISRTHCHLLMIGSTIKEEAYKRIFKFFIQNTNGLESNALWSWSVGADSKQLLKDNPLSFVTYMSKGVLEPKYYSDDITWNVLTFFKNLWVTRTKSIAKRKAKMLPHFDVVLAIREKAKLAYKDRPKNGDKTLERYYWLTMLEYLEENRIRTSVHDLERWYISIVRTNTDFDEMLYQKILSKLNSN